MTNRRTSVTDAPLLAFGEALRARRRARIVVAKRALAVAAGGGLIGATVTLPPTPRLVWNASASMPVGLYAVAPVGRVRRGDLVIAKLPPTFQKLAADRRYLPEDVPLLKRVAGVSGDVICARDEHILINGKLVATRRKADGQGRPMPWWRGCVRLRPRTLFLLVSDVPTSFDGRYFGITEQGSLIGNAHLLWRR
jgi:conjugative transfer signal peptidase TraF